MGLVVALTVYCVRKRKSSGEGGVIQAVPVARVPVGDPETAGVAMTSTTSTGAVSSTSTWYPDPQLHVPQGPVVDCEKI